MQNEGYELENFIDVKKRMYKFLDDVFVFIILKFDEYVFKYFV